MTEGKPAERKCLVVGPSDTWFELYLSNIFTPALRESGFDIVRGDVSNVKELPAIVDLVMVDLRDRSSLVSYVMGISEASKKGIVAVLPVDFTAPEVSKRSYIHVEVRYDMKDPAWGRKLEIDIKDAIVELLSKITLAEKENSKKPGLFNAPKKRSYLDYKNIILAQTGPFRGPSREIGRPLRDGAMAFFSELNQTAGGIQGRSVELISYNDYYEPDRAQQHFHALRDKALAFFSCVGTPTAMKIQPLTAEFGIPFFAPFTGADFLRGNHGRDEKNHLVVNVRDSYAAEINLQIKFLKSNGIRKVACFFQNDSFGEAVLSATRTACDTYDLEFIGKASYERNSLEVEEALEMLLKLEPDAITLGGVYSACGKFVRLAKDRGADQTWFTSVSFVGPAALQRELGLSYEKKVLISAVTPSPWSDKYELSKEYRRVLGAGEISFESFEGYINAKVICEIMNNVKGQLTREGFMIAVDEMGVFDIGGISVYYDADEHNGLDQVFLFKLDGARFQEIPI